MDSSIKIIIGLLAAVLMTIIAHSILGAGTNFVDKLEATAKTQLNNAGVKGVDVAFEREPAISRTAILSGNIPQSDRDEIEQLVRAINGVAEVRWADDLDQSNDGNALGEADKIAAKCQNDINAVMAEKKINFKSGSAYVGPNNFALIDEIIVALKPCGDVQFEIQGHTDIRGSAAINQSMSQARAQSVKAILVERGLHADNITAKGYGASQPINNSNTQAAHVENRRTIFVINNSSE